ncbi:MAG: hypothetical protein A3G24_22770 [Betaproteobacteria bacterium RIFCSPLOWO2_12_FULL_62_13]|nr:MAG: hypothetical protein A3G24_22770 [Betaproteobacteria bacterium RIFCSPLOWO2_12_FULL_62_13]
MKNQLFRGRSPHKRATLSGRVSLYRIALCCRAAPGLGCGSRAKLVLLELESNPAVAEAWLNRSGTLLAVAGKITYPRSAFLQPLLDRHGLAGKAVRGEERARALEGFLSGAGWYRGTEVDRLSEKEAEIIAARLVRRLRARLPLCDEKVEALRSAFARVCAHELVQHPAKPEKARRERIACEILEAGRRHLDAKEMAVLQEVAAVGYRPLRGDE